MDINIKIWSWRKHITKFAPKNPHYKLLLLTLANYMNEAGKSCFPSVDTLVGDTSMSKPTVIKYLKKASDDGWLKISKHGFSGRQWKRNEYTASLPNKVVKEINHESAKVVKPLNREGGRGGKTDTNKVVKELNPNTTYSNTSYSAPTQNEVENYFRERGTVLDKDIPLESEKFINHYSDLNWEKKNGEKINNWHRQAGTWQANYQQWNEDRLNDAPPEWAQSNANNLKDCTFIE